MSTEAAAISRMQKLLKQRRIETKRYEAELKSIEMGEQRVRLAYERNRLEFLNLVRARREKWWKLDENMRRDLAKKDFRDILSLQPKRNSVLDETIPKKVGPKFTQVDFDLPDSSSGFSDLSDDDQTTGGLKILDRVKRSRSSVGKLSLVPSESEQISAVRIRPKTVVPAAFNIQRPKTSSVMTRRRSSVKPLRYRSKEDELKIGVLIERFMRNTPKNVERAIFGGGNEKASKEYEAKLKSQIRVEKTNSVKKDVRYFDLVNCLSENKF